MVKWSILVNVLPLTGFFCLAKLAVHQLGWEPWAFDSMTGSLFGAATFVIAFVLSGTVSDYRTSDGLPTQVSHSISSIQDINQFVAATNPDYDPKPLQHLLSEFSGHVLDWLKQGKSLDPAYDALSNIGNVLVPMAKFAPAPMLSRVQIEQANLRSLIAQIKGVRDTDYIPPAYALLELFMIGAVVSLLLISSDKFSESLVVSGFLFTSFIYLLMLVRDLDNPFQYNGKSSIDADLSLLEATRSRLQSSLLASE
jgi:hypothetical protein